ncbi:hypothetical protein GCM10010313_15500 [Streptomyces violarus]|uniref:histidine kinase n=1 Tax=Streptomyces violarus TaxID=67380 RepID=A0A7W5F024_9ACTN|nr:MULTISPECIES: ATP-binding protein [Streptomyces]MBB3075077.1 two-component system CitB family sensor kinase [Streptomyces violarus]WRT97712.1 ATP-binding protein [Streptomyces sp. CGMCC 4.1772]GHD02140.1 hypothetical protein GCM10010313_15500 [Streptomyces violarus]
MPPDVPDVPYFADAHVRRHERRNALHTLQGLMELARHAGERPAPGTLPTGLPLAEVGEIVKRVGNSLIRAQLVGKLLAASERGVRLRLSSGSFLPGDIDGAGDVVTVVGNLVDNALDAVADMSRCTPTVEVALHHDQSVVELSVSDNGTGVDPVLRQWIFERGASTKPSSSPAWPRGLGLPLVRAITEERGGTITVGDREGGGAVFTVRMAAVRTRLWMSVDRQESG